MNGSPSRAGWLWVGHCSAGKGVCVFRLCCPGLLGKLLTSRRMERWGLGGQVLALVRVVQPLGC